MKAFEKEARQDGEAGNALWFILIAIVLLTALTILLSRGGSSVDQSGDFERQRIQVSQLLRYAKGVEEAVRTMQTRGVSESDISFENPVITGYAHTPSESDDHQVFAGGGGQSYMAPQEEWLDRSQSGNAGYREWLFTGKLGITDNSSSAAPKDTSLVMVLPYVSRQTCIAINKYLRYSGYESETPIEDDTSVLADLAGMDKYNGDGTDYTLSARIDGEDTVYTAPPPADTAFWRRKHAGCTQGTDGRYMFFQTLIVR